MNGPSETTKMLLATTLSASVPLWIEELKRRPWAYVSERARACGQVVAEKGDVIQFKGKGTAEAFNALAEGLACLSFAPGGVRFMDMHFVAQHPECTP